MGQAKGVEVVGDARLITVDTVAGRLLIVEPVDRATKAFDTTMVLVTSAAMVDGGGGSSGESKCYDCWYAYYHCLFSGGKNCDGSGCSQVCKDERGMVFAPSTYQKVTRVLKAR